MPKEQKEPEPDRIVQLGLDLINVPRERVTSVWDPAIEEEFLESVRTKGILEPITVMEIDGQYWLIDGLHRLQAAELLKMTSIPARVIKGSLEELLIQNIIRNRQRGKSNPAQEAEVLSLLVEKKGFPLETAAKQLGMSESWAKKLLKIATLPEPVKDQLKHGKIPVTGAVYLADLPRVEDQINVARDAEFYNYSAEQIKTRVYQLLNPDVEPQPGEITFTAEGKPARVPITCHFCGKILEGSESYVWICAECLSLARDTIDYYRRTYGGGEPQAQSKAPPAPP
jgi:ParB family chromosome partitioning protein